MSFAQTFSASATIGGVSMRLSAVGISHSSANEYPQLFATTNSTDDFLSGKEAMDAASGLIDCSINIIIGCGAVGVSAGVKSISMSGVLMRSQQNEDFSGSGGTFTVVPTSSAMYRYPSSYNALGNAGQTLSAKALIAGIVGAFNSSFGASCTVNMSVPDFIPIVAPRFINMTYMDMIGAIVGSRGLKVRMGFDNIIHISSYIKAQTSDLVLTPNDIDTASITQDASWKLGLS